jgi:hypothetical protein
MNENIIKIGNEKNYNYIYTQEIIENKIILKLEIEIKKDSKKTDNIKEKIEQGITLSNKELLRTL